MRIRYLINGLNGGGAAFPMIDVIRVMRSCGHEVEVLAMMPQDLRAAARLEQAQIPYEIVGSGRLDVVAAFARLLRRLRRDRPDLLWTSLTRATIFGQIAGRLLGIPVVSWQHSAFLKRLNLAILRRSHGLTRRWVADSQAVKQFLQDHVGVAAQRIEVWPLFSARDAAPQAQVWLGDGPFRIGSLGRLHHDKRYDVLVRAAARLRELDPQRAARIEFLVAGEGPEAPALARLAAELGVDTVRFVGFQERPQEFLAGLHAYVQLSRKEGLCLAAHEAMQAGLPVISTKVGEIANSVLDGETGIFCGIGDAEAFAKAALALARDPESAARMGAAGRARVLARFESTQVANAGRAILDRVQCEFGAVAETVRLPEPRR